MPLSCAKSSCYKHLLTSNSDCNSYDGILPSLSVTSNHIYIKCVLWKNQLLHLIAIIITSKLIHLSNVLGVLRPQTNGK